MDAASFQQFLQSSMSNTLPPQTLQARQQPFHPPQHYAIVPFARRLCRCTMASTGAPHSFFADEMHHHRDEQTICEELLRQPLAHPPAVPDFAFRTLLPIDSATAPGSVSQPGNGLRIQVPGVRADTVKTEDFSPISDDDWAQASIEYETPSPQSAASCADSPVTPGFQGESFTDHFFGGRHHANNTVALAWAHAQGFDAKPVIPPVLHSAVPTVFPLPAFSDHLSVVGPANGPPTTNAYFGLPFAATQQCSGLQIFPADGTLYRAPIEAHNSPAQPQSTLNVSFRSSNPSFSDTDETSSQRSGSTDLQVSVARGSVWEDSARASERDRLLLQRREDGWTYRKIKDHYRFPEAEATLRGRYRMLTKDKEERVRKPLWLKKDVELLSRAVQHFDDSSSTRGKLPWKKVGDWIWEHGGSYHFGGSTCAKKWDQLKAARRN